MNLKPEERTKAIQLASLTAVVFVVGGFNIYRQLQGSPSDSGSPTTVTPASETTPNAGSSAILYSGAPGMASQATYSPAETMGGRGGKMDLYADTLPEANGSRDPFVPIDAEPDSDASSAQRFARNTPPPVFHPVSAVPQPHPIFLPGDLTGRDTNSQSARLSQAERKQMEEMTLAGVIAGPSSVAVIHLGDHSYQLGDGEKLPNNMILVRVTDTGIYLKQGSKVLFLEIGKTLRGAIPVNENTKETMKGNTLPSGSAPNSEPGETLQSSESAPSRSEATPERDAPMQVTVNTPSDH